MHQRTIAETLRHWMETDPRINGSENELGRLSGVPQPTIHRILSGESKEPRPSTLKPLANFFGRDWRDLLSDNNVADDGLVSVTVRSSDARDIVAIQHLIDVYEQLAEPARSYLLRVASAFIDPAPIVKSRAPQQNAIDQHHKDPPQGKATG